MLLLCAAPLFVLNIHNDFNWGDDFAQYLKEAQNLAEGKPYYISGYIFNPLNVTYAPPQYPPGFPLLLAPIVKVWGLAIKPMLYLNAVLMTVLLFVLFAFFRRHASSAVSVSLSILCVYGAPVFEFKQYVLSDIPCMLFVTMYFAIRETKRITSIIFIAAVAVGGFAILIRSQAILLPLAELTLAAVFTIQHFSSRKPDRLKRVKQSLVLGAGMLATYLLVNKFLFATPQNHTAFYTSWYINGVGDLPSMLWLNARYLLALFHEAFLQPVDVTWLKPISNGISWSIVATALLGVLLTLRRFNGIETRDILFLGACALALITPVQQGIRFIFPILPIYILYAKKGTAYLYGTRTQVQRAAMAVSFTLIFLLFGSTMYVDALHPYLKNAANKADDIQAFQYIKQHIDSNDIVLFSKPRLLSLQTNRRAVNIAWQRGFDVNKKFLDSLGVNLMLWRDGVSEPYFREYLFATNAAIDSVTVNESYTLYKLK